MRKFDQVTTSSRETDIMAALSGAPITDQVAPAFPLKVQIQTHTRCNAACTMCPYPEVTARDDFAHDQMSEQMFRRILAELSAHPVERVSLFLMNEPLLDRRLPQWLTLARTQVPSAKLTLISNGSPLTRSMAKRLGAAGLDELAISVHGFEKEVYEQTMRGLSFERSQRNLRDVLVLHDAGELGQLEIKLLTGDEAPIVGSLGTAAEAVRSYVQLKGFSNVRDVAGGSNPGCETGAAICQRPFVKLYILTDGTCVLCNCDWNKREVVGRIGPHAGGTIEEIWRGARYQEIRRRHRTRSLSGLLCGPCNYAEIRQ